MDPHYKEVIIVHMSRLPHSHTFFFRSIPLDWDDFCRMRWSIPPTHQTVTSTASKLCSRIAYLKESYRLGFSHPPTADAIFGPMH